MSEDESFDSFCGKLSEVVVGKFNLGDRRVKDSKKDHSIIVREHPCKGYSN